MAWISVHQQVRDHRKTRDLFRTLKINRAEAIGTLTLIWTWAVDNCNQEGELLSVIKEDIADAAYWKGDPDTLYNALVETGWIDEHEGKMYLHDWYDFNKPFYDYVSKKEKDKQRKRNVHSAEIPSNYVGNSVDNPPENRGEFHDSPSPSPSPSPLDINNNNNAREEIEITANESEESVAKTTQVENELSESVSKTNESLSKINESVYMAIGPRAVDWAQKNWGRMIPKGEADSIIAWCDEFFSRGSPESDEVVIEGLRRCLDADVRKMHYLKAVLTDWREAGVLTVAQVEARETDRKSQKEHKRNKDPVNKSAGKTKGKYDNFYL